MTDIASRPARVLRFRRPNGGKAASSNRPDSDPDAPAAPIRDGLATVPIPPTPYRPSSEWGEDTPEELRVIDTLLLWLVTDRKQREMWNFTRHSVTREWPGSTVPHRRRVAVSPGGRGDEARQALWDLSGDVEVGGAWHRVIDLLWHSVVIRYEVTTASSTSSGVAVLLERVPELPAGPCRT